HNGFTLNTLLVDGGPTKNDWLMQYQADLLGCPVMRSDVAELSATGAALLARKALHKLTVAELQPFLPEHITYAPDLIRHHRLVQRWQSW
ncbi:FGGY-family carbohydrate kinase, partial [Escherichia coli]